VHPDHPSDPPRRFVALPSGRVAYTDEGDGPCLVAVHGLPGSVRDYRWLAPALGESIRFVRLDMPGFGETEHADPPTRWSDVARWTVDALTTIVGGPFCVLGHSMGAPQATLVATAGRDVVRGLALLAPVGLRPHRAYRRVPPLAWLDAAARHPLLRRPALHLLRAGFVRVGFPRSTSRHDVARTISLVANLSFQEHRRAVESLRVPVLGAWTEDDPLVEPEIPLELLAACPDGPRLRFATGGHNVQKTHATEVGRALREFVAHCLDRPAPVGPSSS
jgi:pimeloyl-ACP methyl ester carboxylesterase